MVNLKNKKILIVSPHPDDEALGCGGLISVAKRSKSDVFVLFVAVGQCRQLVTGGTEENIRMEEAFNASLHGRYRHKFVFVGNQFMRLDSLPQKDLIDPIEDKIREFEPDIVCLPYGDSYDQDHRAVFQASMTALRPLPQDLSHQPEIILEYEEPYSWNVSLVKEMPNFYIRLSEKDVKFKQGLIKEHATQVRQPPFARSVENIERLAAMRGSEIGIEYAEAYRLLRGMS